MMNGKAAAGLLIGTCAAAIMLALTNLDAFQTVELKTYDWRLARTADPSTARKDIALIEIDEYSLRNLQQHAGRWPWPRVVHASLIEYLNRGKPRLIVYDVLFADEDLRVGFPYGGDTWSGPESDKALADTIKKAGNVLLLADATFVGETTDKQTLPDQGYRLNVPGVLERRVVFPPAGPLSRAAAALGHNFLSLDADGPVRHVVPFVRTGDNAIPSLGLSAALRASGVNPSTVRIDGQSLIAGDRLMPLETRKVNTEGGVTEILWGLIHFRGPAFLSDLKRRPYPTLPIFRFALLGRAACRGAETGRRSCCIQGQDCLRRRDRCRPARCVRNAIRRRLDAWYSGSCGRRGRLSVESRSCGRSRAPSGLRSSSRFALSVGLIATILPAWWAAAAFAAIVAAFAFVATQRFAGGEWINITQPTLASSLALFGGVGYQYFFEGREKRKMKRLFGQYVSKDVYDQLVANPDLARLGGQRRQMTVLFSDIRGFTTVSEKGQPEEIVAILNEYFTRMVEIVFAHKGTLDKFVGDMVMALFGAPLDDQDHAEHAVDAALEMIRELNRLNEKWAAEGRPALDIGIGISTGPMIAGNIGSEAIMSYTVIGDSVNLGARLESLNKEYGTRIIISEATREALPGRYQFRPLGDVVVKGKTRPVAIFEVKENQA